MIAEKLGISEKVLEAARDHQDGSGEEIARALETLERLKREAERERLHASKMKEEAELEGQRLKKILGAIKERRLEIYSKAEEKAKKAVQKVEEELKEWIRRRKEEKPHSPSSAAESSRRSEEKSFPSAKRKEVLRLPGGLKVGERVRIESLRSDGILMSSKPLNRAEVMTDKAKVKAPSLRSLR